MLTALPAKVFFAAFVQPSLLQKGQTAFTAAIRRDRILFQTSHTVKMRLMGLVILLIREMKLRVILEPVAAYTAPEGYILPTTINSLHLIKI